MYKNMASDNESYSEYLQSDHWKGLRLSVLSQMENACCICLVKDPSNDAHHIFYSRRWRDTLAHHLVCLCRSCHDDVHEIMSKWPIPKNPSGHYKNWHSIRKVLRLKHIRSSIMMQYCPRIRALADRRPDDNIYRSSVGLEPKSLRDRKLKIRVGSLPEPISEWFSDSEFISVRRFISEVGRLASMSGIDRTQAYAAARNYLTELKSIGNGSFEIAIE